MVENGNQNSEEKPSPKKIKVGCLIALLVVVLSCCMLVSLPINIKENIAEASSYQSDYEDTASIYSHAMRTNNIEFAKELVSDDNFSKLDEWANDRVGFCYPFIWSFTNEDFLEDWLETFYSGDLIDENSANYGGYELYRKNNRIVYSFYISDMELRLIDDKWIITDLGEIEESSADEKYRKRCRCINIPKFYK
jgi:hypothetical protein